MVASRHFSNEPPAADTLQFKRARTPARAFLALTLAMYACDSGDPLDPEPPGADPNAVLECDRTGYPCSLASVPLDVLQHSRALADSIAVMMRSGLPATQIHAWLSQREEVVDAVGDDRAFRLRVDGGSPFWVIDDRLRTDASVGGTAALVGSAAAGYAIVGDGSTERRALVLSPFLWQFAGFDESPAVAALLEGTRGYEGRVQLMAGETETSEPIPLSVFKTWSNFEVVHISSHGATVCEGNVCRATLSVAIDNRPIEEVREDWAEEGVTFAIGSNSGNQYVDLDADFFRKHYPDGVGNSIVFVSACQTLTSDDTDLADAIRGSQGVYLGWDGRVASGHGAAAAMAFYTRLSEAGVTVGTAYDELGDLKLSQWTNEAGTSFSATLRVTDRKEGGDLRIREIVWLENPAGGAPLTDGTLVAIDGTPGDGSPDIVPYRIRIDGVDAPPDGFTVRVEIGGVAVEPQSLAAAEAGDDLVRVLTGTVALGRDVEEDETLEVRASVELPDQGTSEASVLIKASGDPAYWVGKALFIREWEDGIQGAESLDLRFDHNPDSNRYELTEGTLTWQGEGVILDLTGGLCTYEIPPTKITLPPGSAFIVVSHDFSPARYSVHGSYEGPSFRVPTSCPGVTTPVKFHAVWLRNRNGGDEVSENGNLIRGTYEEDVGFLSEGWSWEFERRTGS